MVQIVLYMYEGKVLMDMLFSFKNKYPISTLPEHLNSTSLSYAETT